MLLSKRITHNECFQILSLKSIIAALGEKEKVIKQSVENTVCRRYQRQACSGCNGTKLSGNYVVSASVSRCALYDE